MMRPARNLCLALLALAVLHGVPREGGAQPFVFSGGRGGPVTIVVRDAPVAEVFEMLSRKEQVNILLGKDVTASVSVNLFDVTLDEAIRAIADSAGYVAERRRGTYVIIERGEAGQDFAGGNTTIRSFKIEYSDPAVVAAIVEKHLSRYGEITVLEGRRLLVVEDLPDFVARIGRLLAEIDQHPRQIFIEAKVLEITLDASETFGIDWEKTFNLDEGTATLGVKDIALKATPGLFFDLLTSDIEIAISALGDKGRVRTLATPTLLAIEHEEAEVVIGERLGFRVTTTINQVTTESIEFLESGVILRFLASVDRNGKIVLQIHPEVSNGTISDGLPSQTTTEVTTKLIVEDGSRIFIGGLLRESETKSHVGVPYIMDIPVLGYLFRRTEEIDVSTETVVILQASVVDGEAANLGSHQMDLTRGAEEYLAKKRRRIERVFGAPLEAPAAQVEAETGAPEAAAESSEGADEAPEAAAGASEAGAAAPAP